MYVLQYFMPKDVDEGLHNFVSKYTAKNAVILWEHPVPKPVCKILKLSEGPVHYEATVAQHKYWGYHRYSIDDVLLEGPHNRVNTLLVHDSEEIADQDDDKGVAREEEEKKRLTGHLQRAVAFNKWLHSIYSCR